MNLFRIDFVQGHRDDPNFRQVVHSIADTEGQRVIHTLSVSPQKLQSVSNFTREPRRLSFQCYIDGWIESVLMNPANEHERYISHFEVRAYRDGVRIFTGIIETSYLSLDHSTEVLSVTCYDNIRLLNVFADVERLWWRVLGYLPREIIGYTIGSIMSRIRLSIPYSETFSPGSIVVSEGEAIPLMRIDLSNMFSTLPDTGEATYQLHPSSDPLNSIKAGFINSAITDRSKYVFACRTVLTATYPAGTTVYRAKYLTRIVEIYNGICTVVHEFDRTTDWLRELSDLFSHDQDRADWLRPHGITSLVSDIDPEGYNSSMSYKSFIHPDIYDGWPPTNTGNIFAELRAHGNIIPPRILPGEAYELHDGTITTSGTKVLQAFLMLHNATLVADNNGRIRMQQKDMGGGTTTLIDDLDILAFTQKRGNRETPNTSILDIFAGDTQILQCLVRDKLIAFFSGKTSISITIDSVDKYDLSLNQNIKVRGKTYTITEIDTDYIKDELRIKAWQQ